MKIAMIKQATSKGYIEMEVGGRLTQHTQTAKHEEAEYRKAARSARQSQQAVRKYTESR